MFQKVKRFLARVLPVPARMFHRSVQEQNRDVKKIKTQLNDFEIKFLRIQKQPRLSFFVLNILDHCNLKCKGCDHFSSIAEERFVPAQTIMRDLARMSKLTEGAVTRIGVMGGEPLLHPELPEILQAARGSFPETLIQLFSNGLLLLQQGEDFWSSCRENNIHIVVTKYPISINFERVEETAKDKKVAFSYFGKTGETGKTSHKNPMDIDGQQDPKKSFWNCFLVNKCPLLLEGKLYPCTVSPNAVHFNKRFSTRMELEKGDFLDIYQCEDNAALLSFLSTPKPFCRYCKTTERTFGHPWARSKQDISEWV